MKMRDCRAKLQLEDPTISVDQIYFGCHQRTSTYATQDCRGEQNCFRIVGLCRGCKCVTWQGAVLCEHYSVVLRHGGHAKKCLDGYCEKVSTPCSDDRQFGQKWKMSPCAVATAATTVTTAARSPATMQAGRPVRRQHNARHHPTRTFETPINLMTAYAAR